MKKELFASFAILVATAMSACTQPTSPNVPSHASIRQNGNELTPDRIDNGVYVYSLANAPFTLLVPSMDTKGKRYRADITQVRICARTDSALFKPIVAGANMQDTCLNSGNGLYNSANQAVSGINLMVGTWNNVVEGINVPGPTYNTIDVRQMLSYKRPRLCFNSNPACTHVAYLKPGTKLYVAVFADMNGNSIIDKGEFTLIELDLH
jgi:hypothetical protein